MPGLGRLLRRRRVPDVVRAVALEPGERRLAWAVTAGEEALVATDRALHLPGPERLEWAEIERAVWERPSLRVLRVAPVERTGQCWEVELAEEGRLPDAVRAQVTASVAWSNHVRLQPEGGVRVVGRRRPGRDLLEWQLVFDRGTDPHDPNLRAQAEAIVLEARRSIG